MMIAGEDKGLFGVFIVLCLELLLTIKIHNFLLKMK